MAAKKKIKIETEPEETTDGDQVSEKSNAEEDKKDAVGEPLKEIQAELKTAKQEATETYDRFLRISAEFEIKNEGLFDPERKFKLFL